MCIAIIPQDTLASTKILVSEWKQYLKLAPAAIIDFIARRTLQFGKEWEMIPERHFLEGVISRTGKVVTSGINISRATFHRWLAWLQATPDANGEYAFERKLMIYQYNTREYGQAVFCYRINPNFDPSTMLKRPRAKKSETISHDVLGGGSHFETAPEEGGSQFETTGGLKTSRYKGGTENENALNENSGLTSAVPRTGLRISRKHSVESALEPLPCESEIISPQEEPPVYDMADSAPNTFRFVEGGYVPPKPKQPVSELEQIRKRWTALETEYVTTSANRQLSPVMPWGKREFGMVKVLLAKWKAGGGDLETFLELITNTLPRWVEITASMGITMSLQPALGLFVKCFTGFRDYETRISLLKEKQQDYQAVINLKRDARKMENYRATGEIDKKDQKLINKENPRPKTVTLANKDALERFRQKQQAARAKLQQIEEASRGAPPANYDDDGIAIITIA